MIQLKMEMLIKSTTAGVFSTLDESAFKNRGFVAKKKKFYHWYVGAVALITIGYLAYQKFIAEPKQRSGKRNVCKKLSTSH
jgi:hypothetical protein